MIIEVEETQRSFHSLHSVNALVINYSFQLCYTGDILDFSNNYKNNFVENNAMQCSGEDLRGDAY